MSGIWWTLPDIQAFPSAGDGLAARSCALEHLLSDLHGSFQSMQPRFATHDGRSACADTVEERFDLCFQRITLIEVLFLDRDRQLPRRYGNRALAHQRQDFLMQVERHVRIVLDDPELALRLHAHAAGGGIGDAAALEADTRI